MSAADVLAAIGRGLAWGAVWTLVAFALGLIIGRAIPPSDDDAEPVDSPAQDAAEADEIALSMQFGGASDFQQTRGDN